MVAFITSELLGVERERPEGGALRNSTYCLSSFLQHCRTQTCVQSSNRGTIDRFVDVRKLISVLRFRVTAVTTGLPDPSCSAEDPSLSSWCVQCLAHKQIRAVCSKNCQKSFLNVNPESVATASPPSLSTEPQTAGPVQLVGSSVLPPHPAAECCWQ